MKREESVGFVYGLPRFQTVKSYHESLRLELRRNVGRFQCILQLILLDMYPECPDSQHHR